MLHITRDIRKNFYFIERYHLHEEFAGIQVGHLLQLFQGDTFYIDVIYQRVQCQEVEHDILQAFNGTPHGRYGDQCEGVGHQPAATLDDPRPFLVPLGKVTVYTTRRLALR